MTANDFALDDMKEIINDFLVEADELIISLDNNLVKLEEAPDDLELLNEIFRAAHTIKGTSGFLGLEQVTTLTHKMEDILNKLRKSEIVVTPRIMDILLKSLDYLKMLLNNVRANKNEEVDLEDILQRLTEALKNPQDYEIDDDGEENQFQSPGSAMNNEKPDGGLSDASVSPDSPVESVVSQKSAVCTADKKAVEQTIRVDVARLDAMINLMGELVLGRNTLVQIVNQLNKEQENLNHLEQINQVTASVNFITTELQLAVMKMRMQPIGKVFKKFPRMVRDLARDAGKQIELKTCGEETELDKSVIEEIGDPLVHVIRNSCDHGIETPEERKAAGKPEKGNIVLTAGQQGSNIIIKIEDDGRGLEVEAIRRKAVEKGLAGQAEVDAMTDREVFRFIFEAGFSTAKKVTDVSGRGVGMDVVRTNIEKLNGLIELDSRKGVGTTIVIKLPLTLAIIQGLLVESNREIFVLPLSSVFETIKTSQTQVYYVNQKPVFKLRDEIIPLINMDIIYSRTSGFSMCEKPYIIVVGLADKKLGINIDKFLGQEEVVIKSLGQFLGTTEGVAGATIMGDGRIRLIVDLVGLFKLAKRIG
ncbi:MAG: chemotaxis protein CheA [candidate division Zixibacteria bacterium]|nr:chemotaxis protein CheA [candidate division Zixibacteria bacterium]